MPLKILPRNKSVPELSRQELLERLSSPGVLLVDALPRASFEEGHIPGSLSLPLADVRERAGLVLPDPSQEVILYCASFL